MGVAYTHVEEHDEVIVLMKCEFILTSVKHVEVRHASVEWRNQPVGAASEVVPPPQAIEGLRGPRCLPAPRHTPVRVRWKAGSVRSRTSARTHPIAFVIVRISAAHGSRIRSEARPRCRSRATAGTGEELSAFPKDSPSSALWRSRRRACLIGARVSYPVRRYLECVRRRWSR